jgi:hypothetical protein
MKMKTEKQKIDHKVCTNENYESSKLEKMKPENNF